MQHRSPEDDLRNDLRVDVLIKREQSLVDYAAISAAFGVDATLDAPAPGMARGAIRTRAVDPRYRKDYDAIPGNHPLDWPSHFAIDRARILAAYLDTTRVGGAVLIVDAADVARLESPNGFAILWDLRVAPDARRRGVGRALLSAAEFHAREAGARGIAIETQDNNVAACKLYAGAGFTIKRVEPGAYPDLPGEARIIWARTFP